MLTFVDHFCAGTGKVSIEFLRHYHKSGDDVLTGVSKPNKLFKFIIDEPCGETHSYVISRDDLCYILSQPEFVRETIRKEKVPEKVDIYTYLIPIKIFKQYAKLENEMTEIVRVDNTEVPETDVYVGDESTVYYDHDGEQHVITNEEH